MAQLSRPSDRPLVTPSGNDTAASRFPFPPRVEERRLRSSVVRRYRNISDRIGMRLRYLDSALRSGRYRDALSGLESYCMFIGYPRSGHSLLGSLLDAHPDIVIAHELDALRFVEAGFSQEQLFYLLIERSKWFTNKGRTWYEYSYDVPNQWNGRFRLIRVIGDKKGGQSSERLARNPQLLEKLRRTLTTDLKIIHVTRNPFDNITTMSTRMSMSLQNASKHYFWLCDSVVRAKASQDPSNWLDLRHEDLIVDPTGTLKGACAFLGQEAEDEYLSDCATLVFDSPRKTRSKVEWHKDLIEEVQERLAQYPFLYGYRFDD